jgi:hypothetical protein
MLCAVRYGTSVPRRPNSNDKTTNTRKIKNIIFAIEAAPAAMPVNPNIAAIIAITMKMIVQRNIGYRFKWLNNLPTIHSQNMPK